jgi:hypothetical protein
MRFKRDETGLDRIDRDILHVIQDDCKIALYAWNLDRSVPILAFPKGAGRSGALSLAEVEK